MQKLVVVGRKQDRLKEIKQQLQGVSKTHPDFRVSVVQPGYIETVLDSTVQEMIFDTESGDINEQAGLEFVAQKAVYEYLFNYAIA